MEGGGRKIQLIYPELSYKIVGILYQVYNEIGYGLQEKYYQKALENEFIKQNVIVKAQCPYLIKYNGELIGKYYVDFIVEDLIVLEIKKGDYYRKRNFEQVLGYLKVTNLKLAILANFTSKGVKYKRILNIK